MKDDTYNLAHAFGKEVGKTFAESVRDALRLFFANYSQENPSEVGRMVMDLGLKGALEVLEIDQNFAEKANETEKDETTSGWIAIDSTPDIDDPNPKKFAVFRDIVWQCSNCKKTAKGKTKFCPHCGKINIQDEA